MFVQIYDYSYVEMINVYLEKTIEMQGVVTKQFYDECLY